MDRYSFREIIELRDYMDWRGLIKELNEEYHRKLSYEYCDTFKCYCIICRECLVPLWNWRSIARPGTYFLPIYRIIQGRKCFKFTNFIKSCNYHKFVNVNLAENY